MALNEELLELLVCPIDKGELIYIDQENCLYNARLRRRYSVLDDIPVMLIDESEIVSETEHFRLVGMDKKLQRMTGQFKGGK